MKVMRNNYPHPPYPASEGSSPIKLYVAGLQKLLQQHTTLIGELPSTGHYLDIRILTCTCLPHAEEAG